MSEGRMDELLKIYCMMQRIEKDYIKISKMFDGSMKERNDMLLKEHRENMNGIWNAIEEERKKKS